MSNVSVDRLHLYSLLLLLLSRFSRVRLCATPKTSAYQAPLSLGFSRHIGTDQHHEHNWGKNIQHPVRTEKNSLGLRDEEDWPELHLQAELEQIKARLKGKNCTGAETGVRA